MGSGLTRHRDAMAAMIAVLAEQQLFFLDSRTIAESTGYEQAREMGLPAAERQVFLDPDPAPQAIHEEFERLRQLARQHGAAVAIAHPHPATLEVLREEVPRSLAEGFDFVPVSFLLDRPSMPAQ